MNSVTPVKITLPDGIERDLRFTLGAKKMIVDLLGMPMKEALDKYDSGAFPEILYALMHDERGNPPSVSVEWMQLHIPADAAPEIMAAVMSAAVQGKRPKNEIEALVNAQLEENQRMINGSGSLVSAPSVSDSVGKSSGGAT